MKDTILVADDDLNNGDLLRELFHEEYKVALTSNGREAMEYVMAHPKDVILMMVDVDMPIIDGRALLKVLKLKGVIKHIPVLMMTSNRDEALITECFENGAIDFTYKPFSPQVVKGRVKNLIKMYRSKDEMELLIKQQTSQILEKNKELNALNDRIIEVMSSMVEFRNLESSTHIQKIKAISKTLAEALEHIYPGEYNITPEKAALIESASALHDIGMITISDSILLKPGKLTADEFEVMKSHTTMGCEVLSQIPELREQRYYDLSYNICRHHHERYDGSGYPDHLKGEAIPIEAQIVALADVYDSLISDRTYRDAFDMPKAYEMIVSGSAGSFSPKLVECFARSRTSIEIVCKSYR